ncbi:MAG: 3-isopropylmalate dehydratase small subunit [Dehalococcoidales bacterium]|nr:3-isopropylmalate dehydratase small subunit [Dehalococcoidales bacterium]
MDKIRGRVWKFGKNVDTDVIIPGRYCNSIDYDELAKHCMEDIDPDFVRKMSPGDIIVADTNFGCGSSREVAPLAIKHAKVAAVVATSFARIFYRNSINVAVPIFESEDAWAGTDEGDELEIDPSTGEIRNVTKGRSFNSAPFPEFVQQIMSSGGLVGYAEARLAAQQ